jgi:tetratricopeptide (TPR) repeat protein
MASPFLSLCLIARNEARNLPVCLASVRGLADEIIVVDTGSTDNTVSLAREAGATVIELEWPNDFSTARNRALAAATGRWILVLDADESLSGESVAAIRTLVAQPPRCAYTLIQRSQLVAEHVLDVAIVRLFPRDPQVRFERPIHEQVNTSLERAGIPIVDTTIHFDHSGYANAGIMPVKTARNRALLATALTAAESSPVASRDPHLRYFYANTFFDDGEFLRAANEYVHCLVQCGKDRPRLGAAARIKAAEAYHLAGQSDLALAVLPDDAAVTQHPLAALLRGEILQQSGRSSEALRWLEAVLPLPDKAYLPPVVVAPLKLKALERLAETWAALGRKDIGVSVLQLGMAFVAGKIPGDAATLQKNYRECRTRLVGRRVA